MKVTRETILAVAKTCKNPDAYVDALNKWLPVYGITTPKQVAHFLAQYSHETGDFNKLVENTNYTTPERLVAVFPKYFYLDKPVSNKYPARSAVGKPSVIANIVYANRFGNGNADSGDGYRYRGRGLCHLTFKANYIAFNTRMKKVLGEGFDFVAKPELLEQVEYAVLAGCDYWQSRNIGASAEKNDIKAVTKLIQGADGGLDDRTARTTTITKYIERTA